MSITATELKNNLGKYLLLSTTEDVFITRNVIIDLEAVVVLFSLCNSFIAFNPKGVAALPSPNIFITIFEDI